ncbi:MAG: hypothetical protein HEQ38_00910 [Gemmatimonas sp.]|jgi:hypothetical protein|nr:hypothetical protein [Gemmatimonas sp.]
MAPSRSAAAALADDPTTVAPSPISCCDALARTAVETWRQHERLARLMQLRAEQDELEAAHGMVDTIDLALAESVKNFERVAATIPVTDQADLRQAANALWLSAREYLRRHSIAERASRQIAQRDADTLGDLQMEYELEASALLGLKHSTATYQKLRPDERC